MAKVDLTDALRAQYRELFDSCDIKPAKLAEVDRLVDKIAENRLRYEKVASALRIPWFFVAAVHCMEASMRFDRHLHNGDPLTARTVQVPAGRPLVWNPPNDWESSADDALRLRKLDKVTDWSLSSLLYQLEGYNGFGYRRFHPDVLTPYLWSFSNHYTMGKYVADGTWDPNAVSKQCGCAVLLRRMSERGLIPFDATGNPKSALDRTPDSPAEPELPMVTYSETQRSEAARSLQQALNKMPGIFLLADGIPGKKTSDAFKKVTGHFLKGDPRLQGATA